MFMLTAVGTAIIIEEEKLSKPSITEEDFTFENVGADKINTLRRKKEIISKANSGELKLDDEVWNFISTNGVADVFQFLLKKLSAILSNEQTNPEMPKKFLESFVNYIDNLPDHKKIDLLYTGILEQNEQISLKLTEIIKSLKLFDYNQCVKLLNDSNFNKKKLGVSIATYDKSFYNHQDIEDLQNLKKIIEAIFSERGTRTTKKQLLSSKEKEIWSCECGKTNDVDTHCSGCNQDIYGFKSKEEKPISTIDFIQQKIELISEYLKK